MLSLCLSRACLGKIIRFTSKWLRKNDLVRAGPELLLQKVAEEVDRGAAAVDGDEGEQQQQQESSLPVATQQQPQQEVADMEEADGVEPEPTIEGSSDEEGEGEVAAAAAAAAAADGSGMLLEPLAADTATGSDPAVAGAGEGGATAEGEGGGGGMSPLGANAPLLSHVYTRNDSFRQDRLGTNIGKALKTRVAFFAGGFSWENQLEAMLGDKYGVGGQQQDLDHLAEGRAVRFFPCVLACLLAFSLAFSLARFLACLLACFLPCLLPCFLPSFVSFLKVPTACALRVALHVPCSLCSVLCAVRVMAE
eukprot:COSAG06_NODE_2583_length_6617_cov_18.685026_5_plen_308_part_00